MSLLSPEITLHSYEGHNEAYYVSFVFSFALTWWNKSVGNEVITVANASAFEPKYTFGPLRAFVCRHWKIYLNIFSNSLTIHQVKITKITTVNEVWIPGLLTILHLRLLLSFCFDWEDISYTRSRQPAYTSSKHLEFRPKILRCGSAF